MLEELKLLPCPNCGNVQITNWVGIDGGNMFYCEKCGLCGPSGENTTEGRKQDALKKWNALPRRSDIECVKRERDWLIRRISGKLCNESKKDCPARDNVNDSRCMECWSKAVEEATSCRKS